MKTLMQKVYKTMVFEIISPFLNCPILRFDLHLQNSSIFVKTVCIVRKYNKIPPRAFSNQVLIFNTH